MYMRSLAYCHASLTASHQCLGAEFTRPVSHRAAVSPACPRHISIVPIFFPRRSTGIWRTMSPHSSFGSGAGFSSGTGGGCLLFAQKRFDNVGLVF